MPGKLKIEIVKNDAVLEIYETEPGKLKLVMYPGDLRMKHILNL